MDRGYIDSHGIVERYLSGDLLVREARAFEKYCLEHPELLAQLPIPVRLKARLAKRPLDDSETGVFQTIPSTTTLTAVEMAEIDDENEAALAEDEFSSVARRKWLVAAAAALICAVAGVAYHLITVRGLETRIDTLSTTAEAERLRPPTGVQSYLLKPGRQGPQSAPSLAIGWPDPPQLLELRIDVAEIRYNAFSVTIEKVGEARVMQIRRIAPDSNRELRLALNSSAFGRGDYRIDLHGYTWRGELVEAGWMRLGLR